MIVSSAFAGQFSENIRYKEVLASFYKFGFDLVFEESMMSDFMVKLIREYVRINKHIRPILSSNCPAVVRLIQVRFPSLLPNLLLMESPMGILAQYYRDRLEKEMNYKPEEIGIFNVIPCIADLTATHQPEGTRQKLFDGAFSNADMYNEIMQILNSGDELDTDFESYAAGLSWTLSGIEADLVDCKDIRTLSVNGIDNV
ncbi:MAG: [Fe-Fe] hydrogenase large subunit C-terminal domain-containing protein, partial [Candidatus Zophobacter franzmannii]|nr:[Fe-Fe] hydrogenase large subunit C-terminal domain-containing protein [Candidatus Zophobacter franzmannii]